METLIKIDIKQVLDSGDPVIVELGCGEKKKPGSIGVDIVDLDSVDVVADIESGLGFLPDNSVDEIHSRSSLEHISNFEVLMREILRVLKKDGKAYIFVPHFSNPHYYSDFTHVRFFGLYSFYYFVSAEKQLRRKVPVFYTDMRITILSIRLKFKSSFWPLKALKGFFGRIINSCSFMQEYYEENLCYIFPAHGIELVFEPAKQD